MTKSGKKNETETAHVAKSDVRHKFRVVELEDFTRRETHPDGSEKMMPRIAVLDPVGGGKHVRAYVPGNLDGPLETGSVVMCRPHDKHHGDGPPIKFRITNVVGAGSASEMLTPSQNAEFAERAGDRPQAMEQQRAMERQHERQERPDRPERPERPEVQPERQPVGAGAPVRERQKAAGGTPAKTRQKAGAGAPAKERQQRQERPERPERPERHERQRADMPR